MKKIIEPRRQFLVRMGGVMGLMMAVPACSKSGSGVAACFDSTKMTAGQKAARDGRKYAEASGVQGQSCANCEFFQVAEGADCGSCAIDSMPAASAGHCTSWIQKSAELTGSPRLRRA